MTKFVLRRLLQAIPTLLGISIVIFVVIRLAPGDPVNLFFDPTIKGEDLERMRRQLGLDRPLYVQYVDWVTSLLRGDFGRSFVTHEPVLKRIAERLPNTIQLSLVAVVISLLVGPTLGILAATHRGGPIDQLVRVMAVAVDAVPNFWLGLMLILILAVQFRLFPSGGMYTLRGAFMPPLLDRLWHLALPALVLAAGPIALYSRLMRTEMLEVLSQDYIRTAQSKGLAERAVLYGHALRNAVLPIVTVLGGTLPFLFGGAVVTESVFSWPGMGRLFVDAAYSRDYPMVLGISIIASVLVVVGQLLSDILYGVVDPRIRYS
ncbi:MAG: diguanylate cyclase [Chloroflexota bacterium]